VEAIGGGAVEAFSDSAAVIGGLVAGAAIGVGAAGAIDLARSRASWTGRTV